jgi:hypothetical protein
LLGEVKSYVTEIRRYFGETRDSKDGDSTQIFFELLTEFASQCTSAVKDLDEWAELVRFISSPMTQLKQLSCQERKQKRDILATAESMESVASHEASSPADRSSSFGINSKPSSADIFRQLQETQNKDSDDRVSFIVRQMYRVRNGLFSLI